MQTAVGMNSQMRSNDVPIWIQAVPQHPSCPIPAEIPEQENSGAEEEFDELSKEKQALMLFIGSVETLFLHDNPLLQLLFLYQLQDPFHQHSSPLLSCHPGIYILDCSFLN
jgi:hypothetical protein